MIAAEIPDPYLIAAMVIFIPLAAGFVTWLVKQIIAISVTNARTAVTLDQIEARFANHEERIRVQEGRFWEQPPRARRG